MYMFEIVFKPSWPAFYTGPVSLKVFETAAVRAISRYLLKCSVTADFAMSTVGIFA
jgi:hypothetical protein